MSFEILKWYLDCVDADGETFIGYAAVLRWKGFALHYQSRLLMSPGIPPQSESTWREFSPPASDGKTLKWRCEPLSFAGIWQVLAPGHSRTLYESARGGVEWNCLAPASAARIVTPQRTFDGRGYAECLRLTLPPWELPLKELRWGRFLSEDDSMVWIDWRGRCPLQVASLNGAAVEELRFLPNGVELAGARLVFDNHATIRDAPISSSIAGPEQLMKILPISILKLHEKKSLSRARLIRAGGSFSSGWAIHEVVTWP